MNIGSVLRAWRHHEELTLAEASRRMGVPLTTLHKIEKGGGMECAAMVNLIRFLFGK